MSNLIYHIEYLKIPHPLYRGKYIIKGDDYNFQKTIQQIYPLYRNSENNLPRIQRKIFLPFPSLNEEKIKEQVREYERNLVKREKERVNIKIIKTWTKWGVCFASSYLIWHILWSLPWLYSTIDAVFRAIGDFLSPYAVVIMILAPSIAAVYLTLRGKDSLWRMYKRLKPLEICAQLGESQISRFIQDIKKMGKNLENRIGKSHPVREEIKNLINILQNKEWIQVKDNLQSILTRVAEDSRFPWGLKENIKTMVEDLLYHLENRFQFAPLKIVTLDEQVEPMEKLRLIELSSFFSSSEFIQLQETIIKRFDSLKEACSTQERIQLCGEISSLFQRMVFLSSRYHLGDYLLPYEKGKILKDLYYQLFVIFGKMNCFLRRKKPGNLSSAGLIKKMMKKIDSLLLSMEKRQNKLKLLDVLATPVAGMVLSLSILAGVMLLTGFHFLTDREFSIIHSYRFGYQSFLGEEIIVRSFSSPSIFTWNNLKLFWYPPKPFSFVHNIDLNRVYHTQVFMILKETEPSGMIDRFFHFFREEWGRGYSGVNLRFTYRIIDPELWAQYDYDGRGNERLSRDLESYVLQYTEKTRGEYRQKLYLEEEEKINSHFQKCLRQGKVGDWIRRFLYPSLFDVYRTGSSYERYLSGLRWLQEHPRMQDEPEWRDFVQHEIENIEKLLQQENEILISQPLKVKEIMKEPALSEIEKYDNLYRTLTYLVVEDFINEKILQEIEGSFATGTSDPVTQGILEWLQQNCQLQKLIGIKITAVERSVREVSALGWQNELRKRENLI